MWYQGSPGGQGLPQCGAGAWRGRSSRWSTLRRPASSGLPRLSCRAQLPRPSIPAVSLAASRRSSRHFSRVVALLNGSILSGSQPHDAHVGRLLRGAPRPRPDEASGIAVRTAGVYVAAPFSASSMMLAESQGPRGRIAARAGRQLGSYVECVAEASEAHDAGRAVRRSGGRRAGPQRSRQ